MVTKKVISKVLSQWPQPFPHWLPRPVGCPALSWPWPPGMPPPGLPSAAGAAWDGERGLTSLRRLRQGSCRVLSGMCIIFPNSMSISYDRYMIYIYIYIYPDPPHIEIWSEGIQSTNQTDSRNLAWAENSRLKWFCSIFIKTFNNIY